jgi:hypothetical protein
MLFIRPPKKPYLISVKPDWVYIVGEVPDEIYNLVLVHHPQANISVFDSERSTDPEEAAIVRETLKTAIKCGFAIRTGKASSCINLSWWKRWVNSWRLWDQPPFIDLDNWSKTEQMPCDPRVKDILKAITPQPVCRKCGSKNLDADPSGYYWHAERWDGAPLLCLDHSEELDR